MTVSLTIDYSNGAHKHFSSIPWAEDLTILGAIQASEINSKAFQGNLGTETSFGFNPAERKSNLPNPVITS